eukprot:745743-Hanusia_phi.AAC.3
MAFERKTLNFYRAIIRALSSMHLANLKCLPAEVISDYSNLFNCSNMSPACTLPGDDWKGGEQQS